MQGVSPRGVGLKLYFSTFFLRGVFPRGVGLKLYFSTFFWKMYLYIFGVCFSKRHLFFVREESRCCSLECRANSIRGVSCSLGNACRWFFSALVVSFVDGNSPYFRFVGFGYCCAFIFRCCDALLEEEIVLLCQPLERLSTVHASF